jgi:hypothetical protein
VRDHNTKQPIAGMWVGPQQNAVNKMSHELYPWETDANGHFTITGLYPEIKDQRIVAVAAPGLPYQTAWVDVDQKSDAPIVIECSRGVPYHLKIVDEAGKPIVDADPEVTYFEIQPNPYRPRVRDETHFPVGWAGKQPDGSYLGYVLPGPGAVLVKTPRSQGYRPARVDPKAFFAPGRTNWTEDERTSAYGTTDTLETSTGRYRDTLYRGPMIDQRNYSAIVLVNPPAATRPDSKPLELTATLVRDRPRMVTLLDPAGQPVIGASMKNDDWWEPNLRVATFPMGGLHPDRVRRVIFKHEKRKLIGFLVARGDGDSPYTVHMQKWGAIRVG